MDKKRMLKNAVHVFLALCFLFVLYFVIPDEGVLEFSERDCLLLFRIP